MGSGQVQIRGMSGVIKFSGCVFEPERFQVRREGQTHALTPQVFRLLDHLLHHRDTVVSKEDLIAAVWGDRIVT